MQEKIFDILTEINPDVSMAGDVKLIDEGILDSFDIVNVVREIEDAFHIEISAKDVMPEHFNSVYAISELVKRILEES